MDDFIFLAQGNRLSCRDQEGRRGSEEAVPGPSVFPSGEPGVSGPGREAALAWASLAQRSPASSVLARAHGDLTSMAPHERLPEILVAEELMLLNCSVGEDSRESLGLQGDQTSPS